jgi:hypothetical protein
VYEGGVYTLCPEEPVAEISSNKAIETVGSEVPLDMEIVDIDEVENNVVIIDTLSIDNSTVDMVGIDVDAVSTVGKNVVKFPKTIDKVNMTIEDVRAE